MSFEEEKLLEMRDFCLFQIKNLEFELSINQSKEDEGAIKNELESVFDSLQKINMQLSDIIKSDT